MSRLFKECIYSARSVDAHTYAHPPDARKHGWFGIRKLLEKRSFCLEWAPCEHWREVCRLTGGAGWRGKWCVRRRVVEVDVCMCCTQRALGAGLIESNDTHRRYWISNRGEEIVYWRYLMAFDSSFSDILKTCTHSRAYTHPHRSMCREIYSVQIFRWHKMQKKTNCEVGYRNNDDFMYWVSFGYGGTSCYVLYVRS